MSSFLDSTGLSRLVSKITDMFAKKDGCYSSLTAGYFNRGTGNTFDALSTTIRTGPYLNYGSFQLSTAYTFANTTITLAANQWYHYRWASAAGSTKYGELELCRVTGNNAGQLEKITVLYDNNVISAVYREVMASGKVGSSSNPVYVTSDGSVAACTPANMTAGKTYVFNKANPTSGKYYALMQFTNNTGMTDRTYSGCMLSFCTRSNNTQNIKGIIFISPYEWNSTNVVAKTIIFGAYTNVSNTLPVFYVRYNGGKDNFQLWVNITGPNTYIELSVLNAGAFDVSVMTDSSDEQPTNSTVCTAVRNVDVLTDSNTSSVVTKGSKSNPAYIASNGSLNVCDLSLNATYIRTNSSSYDLYTTLKPSFICCAILHNATNAASTITIGSGVTTTIQAQTVAVFVWDGTRWYKMPYSS